MPLILPMLGGHHVAAGSSWVPSDDASIVSYYDPSNPANYTVVNVSGTDYVSAADDLAGTNNLSTFQPGPSAGNTLHFTVSTMNGVDCWLSNGGYTAPAVLRSTAFGGTPTETFMVSFAMEVPSTNQWSDESYLSVRDNASTNRPWITFRKATSDNTVGSTITGALDFDGTGMPTDGDLTGGPYSGAIAVQIVADGTANEVYVYIDGTLAGTFTSYAPTDGGFVMDNLFVGGNHLPSRGPNAAGMKVGGISITTDISSGNRADHLTWLQQWAP